MSSIEVIVTYSGLSVVDHDHRHAPSDMVPQPLIYAYPATLNVVTGVGLIDYLRPQTAAGYEISMGPRSDLASAYAARALLGVLGRLGALPFNTEKWEETLRLYFVKQWIKYIVIAAVLAAAAIVAVKVRRCCRNRAAEEAGGDEDEQELLRITAATGDEGTKKNVKNSRRIEGSHRNPLLQSKKSRSGDSKSTVEESEIEVLSDRSFTSEEDSEDGEGEDSARYLLRVGTTCLSVGGVGCRGGDFLGSSSRTISCERRTAGDFLGSSSRTISRERPQAGLHQLGGPPSCRPACGRSPPASALLPRRPSEVVDVREEVRSVSPSESETVSMASDRDR